MSVTYKGWSIRAFKQVPWPKYGRFCAIAKKEQDNIILLFNKEGDSLEDAIEQAKRKIDNDEILHK